MILNCLMVVPRPWRDLIQVAVGAATIAAFTYAAHAAELPKHQTAAVPHAIDMTAPLVGVDGKTIMAAKDKPETIGVAISRVLMDVPDKSATLQQLLARAALAKRIEHNPHAALTAPEVSLIEKLLVEGYRTPNLVAPIVRAIDPAMKPGDIKP